ncbi:MAG: metal-dependent hydrolase [Peptostreptococcaceae bacterium]
MLLTTYIKELNMPSYKAHLTFSIPLSIMFSYTVQLPPELTLLSIAATSLGSLLPDIDTPHSFLGRRIFPISWLINKVFHHRGIFHSIIFYTIIFIPLPYFFCTMTGGTIIVSLYIGIISHILLDRVTTNIKYLCNRRKRNTMQDIAHTRHSKVYRLW